MNRGRGRGAATGEHDDDDDHNDYDRQSPRGQHPAAARQLAPTLLAARLAPLRIDVSGHPSTFARAGVG
jgi:hypothetical protein